MQAVMSAVLLLLPLLLTAFFKALALAISQSSKLGKSKFWNVLWSLKNDGCHAFKITSKIPDGTTCSVKT